MRNPYNNNNNVKRRCGFGLAPPNVNIVIEKPPFSGTNTLIEEFIPASRLTKRLLDFYLKRGRWKSKKRRPLKINQFIDNGLKHIRTGVYAGSQDDRVIRCSMRGIKHLYYVSPNVPCLCQWCTLRPSPLSSEITLFCNGSLYMDLKSGWDSYIHHYINDHVYERQHNPMIKML